MSRVATRRAAGRAPDDDDWARIVARDPAGPSYAVVTTGIVCRAGCPARTPLRVNIQILPDLAPALSGGFRPCLRCRPLD